MHLNADHAMIYHRRAGDSFISLMGETGWSLPEEHARASGGILARTDHWDVPIWVNREGPGNLRFPGPAGGGRPGRGDLHPGAARRRIDDLCRHPQSMAKTGFHIADVEMFGLLARQADIALENARLYEDLRESLRQVEQSQRALIQAEKMSAVGRLTASIAHEVNNPLQAVQNCLHLGQRDELSEEKQTEYLEMADEELARLMHTVQRMLDFYRPGALKKTPTDIVDLIEKVLALLDKQLRNQEIADRARFSARPAACSGGQQPDPAGVLQSGAECDGCDAQIAARSRSALPLVEDVIQVDFQDSGPGVDPDAERDDL